MGLPRRWRFRAGRYRYQVPKGQEHHWDGKSEFTLGKTLAEAHRTYSARIQPLENARTIAQAVERYLAEVTPTKGARTQQDEPEMLIRLSRILGDNEPAAIEPHHCYQVYKALRQGPDGRDRLTWANRHMEKLSHLFTKCIEWGMMRDHPMTGNRFRKQQPAPPRIYVTDDQVIEALELAPPMIEAYCWLKLITGLRMTDLLSLRWSDWKDDGLHVTPSKTLKSTGRALVFERSKVLDQVMGDLKRMTNFHIREYVFVNREGRPYIKPNKSVNGFQSAWQRWMRKVNAAHGFTFSERQLRVKVGSDAESAQAAAERLANDPRVAAKHYRAKPARIKTGD